jgi:tRNA A-37 threonylcarbamoyl transferase component Bud32/dienelactone hydrolase
MTEQIRQRLAALSDKYELGDEVGHGGMATVYRARDIKHGRTVAIKVLRPELAQALGGERFLREINIAAQLQSPHILPLLDSGEVDGLLYYVMPYIEGDSLRGLLARGGALPPSEAMRLLREIVDGLAHAHRNGVVHRDIKPDNVMIAERHALVVDFGIAKAVSDAGGPDDITSVGTSLGTPAYMAPEQAAADPNIDHRADIYSVGVMAYEMLCGAPPFTGTPQAVLAAQITQAPEPIGVRQPAVPPAIANLVMRCLEKAPGDRFQTADALLHAIEALVTPSGAMVPDERAPAVRTGRRLLLGVGVAAVAVLMFFGYRSIQRDRWVHQTAIPEIRRMTEAAEYDSAWYLAREVEAVAPDDSTLATLWDGFARPRSPATVPEGVTIERASLADTSVWYPIGVTPFEDVMVSRQVGLFRFTKPGYRPLHLVSGGYFYSPMALDRDDAPDPEMMTIAGAEDYGTFLVGADGAPELALEDWQIDRYETSNREFKAFVDAGGYRDSTLWEHPFRLEGRTLSRDEAMARFVDQSGRPGPATWVGGDYPADQGEMPVGGVSWYEAAAYAKWQGKSLPTIYHWAQAAAVFYSQGVVPESNLGGTGPWPVGTPRAVSMTGVSDMAGNVREWVENDAGRGLNYILGGGWSDPTYGFVDAYAQPPMDRSVINGIRLARYAPTDSNVVLAMAPRVRKFVDYTQVASVSEEVFQGFLPQFDYDPLPLDAQVEVVDSTSEEWNAEFVSFTAAYGGERMQAWVFTPKATPPPYQTVVYFPGSGAINTRTSAEQRDMTGSFVVKSGRAFVLPIYTSTYERSDSLTSDLSDESIFWRDHVVMWVKDYRRTLDYLESRPDIDADKFAYFGYSWGGYMGGIIPAVEPRIKAAALYVAGLTMERGRPEVEPINYLPHITIPVVMLNGKYDFFFPTETAQRPFFERLGTPAADKKWVVYEGGHDVPKPRLVAETFEWFDKYLGPVE